MIDQPLLQLDQLLLTQPEQTVPFRIAGQAGARSVPPQGAAMHALSLDFAIGQFHLLAGEDVRPLARLLRVIAGYEPMRQGRLLMRGQPLAGIPLGARGIASLTGDPRLFPQLTIGRNILFPLSGDRRIGDTATAVAGAALRVGLSAAALDRYPDEVSQATQLRAALARALALGPSLLLLTDPLRDLPAGEAAGLLQDLRRLQRELSLTVICASDRLPYWAPVADRVVLLETAGGTLGGIIQGGSAEEIYLRPESRMAARLSGAVNLLPVEILGREGDALSCRSPLVDPPHFSLPQRQVAASLWQQSTALPEAAEAAGEAVRPQASLLLRPSLLRPGLGIRRQDFRIEGRIQDRFSDGATVVLQVMVPGFGAPVIATMPAPAPFPLEPGMAVSLGWNRGDMRLLPDSPPPERR
ncbi:MAG TPA: ATP-binding cassette domain-containing protein [Terriglobia bacterium]|nr:ATP-binding cassette domain-containing protein [Terriglobia bacterium]